MQLAALLTSPDGEILDMMDVIIQAGRLGHRQARKVHGITTHIAEEKGIPIIEALDRLKVMLRSCSTVVAHQKDFDVMMMRIETAKAGRKSIGERKFTVFCTMDEMRNVVQFRRRL